VPWQAITAKICEIPQKPAEFRKNPQNFEKIYKILKKSETKDRLCAP